MARGLKCRIKELEGLYYPCSENKVADQIRGYRSGSGFSHDEAQIKLHQLIVGVTSFIHDWITIITSMNITRKTPEPYEILISKGHRLTIYFFLFFTFWLTAAMPLPEPCHVKTCCCFLNMRKQKR